MNKKRSESSIQTRQTPQTTPNGDDSTRNSAATQAPPPFSADELRRISAEITAHNPPRVEATRLGLMEIDPWNVHAYWHINPADIADSHARLPENTKFVGLVLRFNDISSQLNGAAESLEHFDIEVREDSNNWYVNLWRAAKRYSAEIGLRTAEGTFMSLAHSNEIVTPRAGPSPDLDFIRAVVRPPGVPAPGLADSTVANHILLKDLFPQRQPLLDEYPLAIAGSSAPVLDEPAFPDLEAPTQEAGPVNLPAGDSFEAASAVVGNDVARELAPSGTAGFPLIESYEINRFRILARLAKKRVLLVAKPPHLPPPALDTIAPTGIELSSRPLPVPSTAAPDVTPAITPLDPIASVPGHSTQAMATLGEGNTSVCRTTPVTQSVIPYPAEVGICAYPSAAQGQIQASQLKEADALEPPPASVELHNMMRPLQEAGIFKCLPAPVALESILGKTVFSSRDIDNVIDVSASIVIEGRSSPEIKLTLFGEPVPQQQDGSFRLRMPITGGPDLVAQLHHLHSRCHIG